MPFILFYFLWVFCNFYIARCKFKSLLYSRRAYLADYAVEFLKFLLHLLLALYYIPLLLQRFGSLKLPLLNQMIKNQLIHRFLIQLRIEDLHFQVLRVEVFVNSFPEFWQVEIIFLVQTWNISHWFSLLYDLRNFC